MTNFRRLFPTLVTAAYLSAAASAPAFAEDQSHLSIQRTAAAFVAAEAGRFAVPPQVTPGDLDSRLRLPRCAEDLQAFEPPNGLRAGRTVVGVRCEGDKPWKLYVPVQVSLPGEVIVAARPLRRGATLTRDDLAVASHDLASLHRDYFLSAEHLVGQRVRRNLGRGDVLTPSAVEADQLVKRGTEVTILAANPQVQVRMRGKALANGAQGERIKVRNLSSEREISATVIGRALVQATP